MTHDGDSANFANMSEWFRCQFANLITAVRIRLLALKLKLNNMTKKEFLAFSLPYALKCKLKVHNVGYSSVLNLSPDLYDSVCNDNITWKTVLPLLRNLYDLTKEIEHNGEKFVPIVELAKLTGISGNFEIKQGKENEIIAFVWDGSLRRDLKFNIKDLYFEKTFWIGHQKINQLSLFQKLISWHFAIGLDENDYIDVNTLETNPYK